MKKLKIIPFAKFQAILFTLVGFILGVIYSFGGFIIDLLVSFKWITTSETPGLSYGTLLAFGALIGMPVIFGFLGFLLGIIEAYFFNLFNRWFSIDINIEAKNIQN